MKPKLNRTTITMVVSQQLKDTVRQLADAQNRSMTSYIEWLIMQDAEKNEPKNRRGFQ